LSERSVGQISSGGHPSFDVSQRIKIEEVWSLSLHDIKSFVIIPLNS
jgi:hypothetical protein